MAMVAPTTTQNTDQYATNRERKKGSHRREPSNRFDAIQCNTTKRSVLSIVLCRLQFNFYSVLFLLHSRVFPFPIGLFCLLLPSAHHQGGCSILPCASSCAAHATNRQTATAPPSRPCLPGFCTIHRSCGSW